MRADVIFHGGKLEELAKTRFAGACSNSMRWAAH
jgi:hypothetical protein